MKNNGLMAGVVMVVIFAAGIFLGYYFGAANGGMPDGLEGMMGGEEKVNDGSVSANVPEEGITVDTSGLSDTQRKMLETMGVDTENIILTPEMVVCAEAKVGSARLLEIQNGASPSVSEGASLAACYR